MKIITVILAALVTGCAARAPTPVDQLGGRQRWSAQDIVLVAVEDGGGRIDTLEGWGGGVQIATGAEWQKVFIGDATKDPVFTIDSTQLRNELAGAGFVMRYRYTVTGRVVIGARAYTINAEGTRASAANMPAAMQEAIQLGIADASQKVQAVMLRTKP